MHVPLAWMRGLHRNQAGLALPIIILFTIFMAAIAYVSLLQASNGLSVASKTSHIGMSRVAAKSALDFAQEQYDANPFYSGTPETTLTTTSLYRVTYEINVIATDASKPSVTVEGIGKVYVPASSTTSVRTLDRRTKVLERSSASFTPPQRDWLTAWYRMNGNGIETLTGLNDYRISQLTKYGYGAEPGWGGKFGNNGSLGYIGTGSPLELADWSANWSPDQGNGEGANMTTGAGTVCVWLKSDDGLNETVYNVVTVSRGERGLSFKTADSVAMTHIITADIYMDKTRANRWTAGFRYDGNPGSIIEIPSTLNADSLWHQHCLTIDAGQANYFTDGLLAGSAVLDNTHNPLQPNWYHSGYGGGRDGSFTSPFDGLTDELMVWKTALSAAEITAMYLSLK